MQENSSQEAACKIVVGIGYSAGGQQALMEFFDQTPCDSVTYVIVRHFPADQKSALQHILQKHSDLEVIDALHDMHIENNKVYVAPPNQYLKIRGGRFICVPRPTDIPNVNRSIDFFFKSLAAEKGMCPMAVVLSGFESDGARGAARIKEKGGVVIVQHPDSCFAPHMPVAVMNATIVDHVTLPSRMPGLIQRYANTAVLNFERGSQNLHPGPE